MTIPTAQDFLDGKEDLDTLEEIVESEAEFITTRSGTQRRTLSGINNQFDSMQSGELTAQAVDAANRADAAADAAALSGNVFTNTSDGITSGLLYFSIISPDEGYLDLYKNDGGTAVYQKSYPSTDAIDNALSDLSEKVDSIPAKTDKTEQDLEVFTDEFGAITRRTDAAGEQYIPGLDGQSVQQRIRETSTRIHAGSGHRRRNIMQVEDDAGNVAMFQDERGGLYLPGLPASVQAGLGVSLKHQPYFPSDRDRLHDIIRPMTAALREEGMPFIEPPPLLVPNRYDVPDGIISAFSCEPGTGQPLETPYGSGGTVHPYLLEMRKPVLGYRYLLGETPHLPAWQENPIIYGSNDLKTFDLILDFPQPLGHPPGGNTDYNSDIFFTYDPRDGELICIWREYKGGNIILHYRSTWNGFDWSPKISVPLSGNHISPSILYDPEQDVWHLWSIPAQGMVRHYTSSSVYGPWEMVGSDNIMTRFGIDVWHMEVKWLGSRFAILANVKGELPGANLYLGLSDDGTTWEMGPGLIQPEIPYVYKGTFLPEFNGDQMRLNVAWNIYVYPFPDGVSPVFHCQPTNWVDLTTL